MGRRALVTGITGQDGSFLAELLVDRGYEVWGTVRGPVDADYPNLRAVHERIGLLPCELADLEAIGAALDRCRPNEVYNLASTTFVPRSWEEPLDTVRVNAMAVTALLEAVRTSHPGTRIFSAASGAIFGATAESPQTEDTPCRPATPYAIAKLHAHLSVGAYRARYGLHASSCIAYNHESTRRPPSFVTRKVTRAAAAIKLGLEQELALGDLDATRDWGYAPDYVEAMWLMLQQDEPDDYVVATGVGRTVKELVDTAFEHVGIDPALHVRVDPRLVRPRGAAPPIGDSSRARARLGWEPRTSFEDMVAEMVDADLRELAASSARTTTETA
jgi:GDPmannose 4,6-dehydratase